MSRNNLCQLKDAYTKLFEDYTELKEEGKKKKEEVGERAAARGIVWPIAALSG